MAGIRGTLMGLILVFGTASGQATEATSAPGTQTPATADGEGRGSLKNSLRIYNYGRERSTPKPSVVSRVILDNGAHCTGSADVPFFGMSAPFWC